MKNCERFKKVLNFEEVDHSVSSDISFENFSYYIKMLKEIYGIK